MGIETRLQTELETSYLWGRTSAHPENEDRSSAEDRCVDSIAQARTDTSGMPSHSNQFLLVHLAPNTGDVYIDRIEAITVKIKVSSVRIVAYLQWSIICQVIQDLLQFSWWGNLNVLGKLAASWTVLLQQSITGAQVASCKTTAVITFCEKICFWVFLGCILFHKLHFAYNRWNL